MAGNNLYEVTAVERTVQVLSVARALEITAIVKKLGLSR